jgi:AraC-like DNA-binding protein
MDAPPPTFDVRVLLETPIVSVRDVVCGGECRHKSAPEWTAATALVFPYRGTFLRHVGDETVVADPNVLLFFNAGEEYRISHPVEGGDACLSIVVAPALLRELVPRALVMPGEPLRLTQHSRLIDARTQALVALLRHSLTLGSATPLEGESLLLTLVRRAFGERTSRTRGGTYAQGKLVERTKLLLMAAPERKWSLSEIGAELKASPVYLTQVFRRVENLPLHQYLLRLRLARALDRLGAVEDLTQLALALGFSSHSHFTAAFRQVYGRSPADFQRATQVRR